MKLNSPRAYVRPLPQPSGADDSSYPGRTRHGQPWRWFFRKKYYPDFNNKLANDIAMGKANSILIEYARTRLYPYMRKYSPKGYSGFVRKINNGTYKVSEFFDAMENGISKEESVSVSGSILI